jgi:hypothetical protein
MPSEVPRAPGQSLQVHHLTTGKNNTSSSTTPAEAVTVLLEIKEFSHDSMVTTNVVQRDHCLTRFIGSSWVPYSVRIFTFTEAPSRSCNSSRGSSCNFESKTSRRKCNKKGFSVSLHCVCQQQITLYTSSAEQYAV